MRNKGCNHSYKFKAKAVLAAFNSVGNLWRDTLEEPEVLVGVSQGI